MKGPASAGLFVYAGDCRCAEQVSQPRCRDGVGLPFVESIASDSTLAPRRQSAASGGLPPESSASSRFDSVRRETQRAARPRVPARVASRALRAARQSSPRRASEILASSHRRRIARADLHPLLGLVEPSLPVERFGEIRRPCRRDGCSRSVPLELGAVPAQRRFSRVEVARQQLDVRRTVPQVACAELDAPSSS